MNIRKNNYLVENVLKNSVKNDRAKMQIGRISPFGLLEMSRQRLRPSLFELNFKICSACDGLGMVRSIESQSLQIIRNLEAIMKGDNKKEINLELHSRLAEYLLNNKYKLINDEKSLKGHSLKIIINNNLNENKFSISIKDILEKEVQEEEVNPKKVKPIRPNIKKNIKKLLIWKKKKTKKMQKQSKWVKNH